MTKYEYHQDQIDDITNTMIDIYQKFGKCDCFILLENAKQNIREKQLNLTIESGKKKANFFYRIFI